MTDNLFDYQIKIGETVYQFPMSVEDFKKTGLTYSEYEDPTDKISSGRKDLVWFSYPDGSKINARLVNFSKSETEYDNCTVVGISVSNDTYNIKFDPTKISTAKGITLNLSTTDDIIAAFGRPSDEWISNDKSTIKYTYEEDIYKTIEFHFNGSTKTLTDIDFENVEKPDNITEKGPSNQIPQLVKDYKQPTALGTDITSGVVELDKVLYKLPLPVSELIKNGWKITEKSQDTIPGRDYAHISLSKGNIELENISIRNYEEYETTLENGIIEEFTTTKLTHTEKNRLILPRNINTEMGESDFVKATKDLTVNKKESKYYVTYQITNGNISASITFENGIMRYFSLYWAKP